MGTDARRGDRPLTGAPLTVALLSEIYPDLRDAAPLTARLRASRSLGADLVVLPELPLNRWIGAVPAPSDDDAEPPGGARHRVMAAAAREAGVALLGGAIVRDTPTGRRHNTALLFDAAGSLIHACRKLHLPDEEGFRETRHYEPGDDPPAITGAMGLPLGIQICSDVNRPEGTHLLGALGAAAILCPRATETGTWPRWRTVLQANAITSCAWVLTVNRPHPEAGVPLGGPAACFGPDGRPMIETTEPLACVTLDPAELSAARLAYPGYLPVRAGLYARGWESAADPVSTRR